jgi:hypothetical protein
VEIMSLLQLMSSLSSILSSQSVKSARSLCGIFILMTCCGSVHAQINIAYDKLNHCQQKKFEMLLPTSHTAGAQAWQSLEDSQRLEYAGSTQALITVDISPPPCKGFEERMSVNTIWGSRPSHSSADQFHVEVDWAAQADQKFKAATGWYYHIPILHPKQYGYAETRGGNPFLGIVVLFGDVLEHARSNHAILY